MEWLWTVVTITPSRPNGCIGEINRGSSGVRYSKDIEGVGQPCIEWDKHEVRSSVCGKKPSSVSRARIVDLLPNVVRLHIPHSH